MINIPPITDHLPVSRCAALRRRLGGSCLTRTPPSKAGYRWRAVAGASPWTLTFDCETTTHPGQTLRFGAYQLRNAGALVESGLVLRSRGHVYAEELETPSPSTPPRTGLNCGPVEGFVDDVFFGRAWQLRATLIGFNLPFDISRLASCARDGANTARQ